MSMLSMPRRVDRRGGSAYAAGLAGALGAEAGVRIRRLDLEI
jgi:hypothetical protein